MTVNISGVTPATVAPAATAAFAFPRPVPGASAGVGTLLGVVTPQNPAGVLEFVVVQDTRVLGPALLRLEVCAPDSAEWAEVALPATVRAGARVRLSQR